MPLLTFKGISLKIDVGVICMDDRTLPLCQMDEDVYSKECEIMILREQCATLEEKVHCILTTLDEEKRITVEEYIRTRGDLEVFMLNKAIRFGKKSAAGKQIQIKNIIGRDR